MTESSHTADVLEIVQISRSASLLQCWMLELQLQIKTKEKKKKRGKQKKEIKNKRQKKKLEASELAESVEHVGRPSE